MLSWQYTVSKKSLTSILSFSVTSFTDEDKKNQLETGNMGRVVNLVNSKTGELMPSIISIDRLTNDVVALRTDFIKIPDELKGVKLNDEQKANLNGRQTALSARYDFYQRNRVFCNGTV